MASTSATGIVGFSIDGIAFDAKTVTWKVNGISQEFITTLMGVSNSSTVEFKPGMITASLMINPIAPPGTFVATGAGDAALYTININLRNGGQVIGTNCIVTEAPETNPVENTFDIEFSCQNVTEVY